jgi:hypothetical protein
LDEDSTRVPPFQLCQFFDSRREVEDAFRSWLHQYRNSLSIQQILEELSLFAEKTSFEPEVTLFNHVLHMYTKDTEELNLVYEALVKQCSPNMVTFGFLFEALRLLGDEDEIARYFKLMKQAKIAPSSRGMFFLVKNASLKFLREIYPDLRNLPEFYTTKVLFALLTTLIQHEALADIKELQRDLALNQAFVTPSIARILEIVNLYLRGELSNVELLNTIMKARKIYKKKGR